jgi:Response regulator containing a CheY-like receiver domain and an HTH DNA-binding domain
MQQQPLTVAIVDDHLLMRQCTQFRCSLLGYQVILEAENGRHFLSQLENAPIPDICLLDINMPVMNGFDTIVQLKKRWPRMKVVFLSMHDEHVYIKKSMDLGADGFIQKDAPVEVLKNLLLAVSSHKNVIAA